MLKKEDTGMTGYFVSLLLCFSSLLTIPSVTMFVSRKTWHERTVHSKFRRILQSQIEGPKPEPYHLYLLANERQVHNQFVSLYIWNRVPKQICKPSLIAHNSVELFVVLLMRMENHIIHFSNLSRITPPPLAVLGFPCTLQSVLSVTNWSLFEAANCQVI